MKKLFVIIIINILLFHFFESCNQPKYTSDLLLDFRHEKLEEYDWSIAWYRLEVDTIQSENFWTIRVYHNALLDKCCDCHVADIEQRGDTLELLVDYKYDRKGNITCPITTNGHCSSFFEYKIKKVPGYDSLIIHLEDSIWHPISIGTP